MLWAVLSLMSVLEGIFVPDLTLPLEDTLYFPLGHWNVHLAQRVSGIRNSQYFKQANVIYNKVIFNSVLASVLLVPEQLVARRWCQD